MRNRNTLRDVHTLKASQSTKDQPRGFAFTLSHPKCFNPYTAEAVRSVGWRCRIKAGFLDRENAGSYEIYLQGLRDEGLLHPHNVDGLPEIPLLSEGPGAVLEFIKDHLDG